MSSDMAPFVEDLIAAMPTPHARAAATAVLAKWAGCSVYIASPSKADRRQSVAANMLRNGGSEPGEVARALVQRFGVSERTAWRDIANSQRQMSEENGTTLCANRESK